MVRGPAGAKDTGQGRVPTGPLEAQGLSRLRPEGGAPAQEGSKRRCPAGFGDGGGAPGQRRSASRNRQRQGTSSALSPMQRPALPTPFQPRAARGGVLPSWCRNIHMSLWLLLQQPQGTRWGVTSVRTAVLRARHQGPLPSRQAAQWPPGHRAHSTASPRTLGPCPPHRRMHVLGPLVRRYMRRASLVCLGSPGGSGGPAEGTHEAMGAYGPRLPEPAPRENGGN